MHCSQGHCLVFTKNAAGWEMFVILPCSFEKRLCRIVMLVLNLEQENTIVAKSDVRPKSIEEQEAKL